eukprot:scaffold2654_cov126-Cylindrotheca_fusiformis.AAC.9
MKCNFALFVAAATLVDSTVGFAPRTRHSSSSINKNPPFSSSRLQYKAEDYGENLTSAYDYWCKTYGQEAKSGRKEIFSYHYLLAERFYQTTGVRLELNEHADLTDHEYVRMLSKRQQQGQKQQGKDEEDDSILLKRPPAMEAEHKKFQEAYQQWCQTYNKEMDPSRLEIFSYHHLLAEQYLEETGTVLQLNEYADRTEEEYQQILENKKQEEENALKSLEPLQVSEPPTRPAAQQPSNVDTYSSSFTPGDSWWETSGGSSSSSSSGGGTGYSPQSSWWESGSSSSVSQHQTNRNHSAQARWRQQSAASAAAASEPQTSTQDHQVAPQESANQSHNFWSFLGDNSGTTPPSAGNEHGTTNDPINSQTPSTNMQGPIPPSSVALHSVQETAIHFSDPAGAHVESQAVSTPADQASPPAVHEELSSATSQVIRNETSEVLSDTDSTIPSSSTPFQQDSAPEEVSPDPSNVVSQPDFTSPSPLFQEDSISTSAAPVSAAPARETPASPYSAGSNRNDDWWGGSGSISDVSNYYNRQRTSTYSARRGSVPSTVSTSSVPTDPLPTTVQKAAPPKTTSPSTDSSSDWWNSASISSHEMDAGSSRPPAPKESKEVVSAKADLEPNTVDVSDPQEVTPAVVARAKQSVGTTETDDQATMTTTTEDDTRLQDEYGRWCKTYGKEMSPSRMKIFIRNMVWAEEYSQQTGVELEMNEHADLTEKEYLQAMASGDGAGPSYKPSVLTSRKKKRLDDYRFQKRLLATSLEIHSKSLQRQKRREVQVANYQFQQRLLEARIRYDALAVHKEKTKKECAFQQDLLEARIKNDFVRSQRQKEKMKNAFQQRLLGARVHYATRVQDQQAAEDEGRSKHVAFVDSPETLQKDVEKSSMYEKLYEAKVDKHFENDDGAKRNFEVAPTTAAEIVVEESERLRTMEIANTKQEDIQHIPVAPTSAFSPAPVAEAKSARHHRLNHTSQAEEHLSSPAAVGTAVKSAEPLKVGKTVETDHLATASSEFVTTAKNVAARQHTSHDLKAHHADTASEVQEKHSTSSLPNFRNAMSVIPVNHSSSAQAATNQENAISNLSENTNDVAKENLAEKRFDAVVAAKPRRTSDQSNFDFVSSYQGLAGPSKAGLVLAIALTFGLVATSPDVASHIDWTQPGLTDLSSASTTVQHILNDFVHTAQGGLATFANRLSELQSSWASGIQEASQAAAMKLEAARESAAAQARGISEGLAESRADPAEGLHATSQQLSSWQADRMQNMQSVGESIEKSIDTAKEIGRASLEETKTAASGLGGMLNDWSARQK